LIAVGIFPEEVGSPLRFKGFLASVYKDGKPIGEMRPANSLINKPNTASVKTTCNGKSSLTHSNNLDKEEIIFQWKAPATLQPTDVVELR